MRLASLYRRLPEDVRRILRPLNAVDEVASFLPHAGRRAGHGLAEAGRRLLRLRGTRFPVRRIVGRAAGSAEPLSVRLGMDDLSARYWIGTLFAGTPGEELQGEIPALAVPSAAARCTVDTDLALWQLPWPVRGPQAGARVPSWVPLWLDTARSLDQLIAGERSGRAARKNDVRRVARLGLDVRVHTDAAAYERFRRELYVPYVRWRFDELAVPVQPHVFRQARRHGALILLESDGRPVSGALIDRGGARATVLVFGVRRDGPVPAGHALEAAYYHVIRFAVEHGVRRLSLGACRPVLTDGVLRYKRKWGARIGPPTTWDAFALRYANTPGARAALTAAPLIVQRGRTLAALIGAAGESGQDVVARVDGLDVPGLGEIGCLVERDVRVAGREAPRDGLRVVLPGEVWPPEARLPEDGRMRPGAAA